MIYASERIFSIEGLDLMFDRSTFALSMFLVVHIALESNEHGRV